MRRVETRPSSGASRQLLPRAGEGTETALQIARGVRRLLRERGYASVTELPLLDGRRADVVALAADGALLIVEIKSSIADFRADLKWRDYAAHCDRLYFAISDAIPREIMPDEAGLIVADRYGAEIVREAAGRTIAPATRRAGGGDAALRRGGAASAARAGGPGPGGFLPPPRLPRRY